MIVVHAKHIPSNRTTTLFSVVYRPNRPYPATIQPKDDELPKFLKHSYYSPGIADIGNAIISTKGGTIKNPWVCDTPSQFRIKLEEVINLGVVKSEILNLVSESSKALTAEDQESTQTASEEDEPNGES